MEKKINAKLQAQRFGLAYDRNEQINYIYSVFTKKIMLIGNLRKSSKPWVIRICVRRIHIYRQFEREKRHSNGLFSSHILRQITITVNLFSITPVRSFSMFSFIEQWPKLRTEMHVTTSERASFRKQQRFLMPPESICGECRRCCGVGDW